MARIGDQFSPGMPAPVGRHLPVHAGGLHRGLQGHDRRRSAPAAPPRGGGVEADRGGPVAHLPAPVGRRGSPGPRKIGVHAALREGCLSAPQRARAHAVSLDPERLSARVQDRRRLPLQQGRADRVGHSRAHLDLPGDLPAARRRTTSRHPIAAALREGGVHGGIPGNDKESVLRAVVGRLHVSQTVDRDLLLSILHGSRSAGLDRSRGRHRDPARQESSRAGDPAAPGRAVLPRPRRSTSRPSTVSRSRSSSRCSARPCGRISRSSRGWPSS